MIKRILLSLFFLVGGYFIVNGNAQNVDGFFKASNNEDIYNNRGDNNNGITLGGITNNENPTAPLGSGLLIMVAAGAGYAVARRKNAARKGMTMLVALSLILCMTGCKKDIVTPISTDNGINITLNANYGDNGSKTTFDPEHGTFAWAESATEYINVGGSVSGYLGQLTNAAAQGTSTFAGTLDKTPKDGETLYFFYLGKGNHAGASTVDFSSQDGTLANVTNCHIAIGNEAYTTGQTSFNAELSMAMAIAYFDLSQFTSDSKAAETVYLNGNHIYSTASVNYNDGTITGNSKGYIKVGTANNGMYVALIPSVTTSTTLNFNSNSKTGSMTFNNGIKPAYFYSNSGGALLVEATAESGIPGTFSVSATKKVFFSPGNLQYLASTGTWRFAEHQYDYIGNAAGNTTSDANRPTQSDWIDLFGFGTSGRNGKNPYLATTQSNDYIKTNLSGDDDWGSVVGDKWRTLTKDEWVYLFNRTDRKGTGSVNNIKGLILLPDLWTGSAIVTNCADWTSNSFTAEQWSAMELAGAVFLPASGYRDGIAVKSAGLYLYYWSSVMKGSTNAYSVYVYQKTWGTYDMVINTSYDQTVYYGLSVRLVYDVE